MVDAYSFSIGKMRAAVMVERIDRRTHTYRVVPGELVMLDANALVRPLPDGYKIIDEDGNEILATGRFLITVETIDPYHLVTDMF